MKLKILPPTLRPNYRYLFLDIKSEVKINKDELVSAVWDACIRFYGENQTSTFYLWLMRFYEKGTNKENLHNTSLDIKFKHEDYCNNIQNVQNSQNNQNFKSSMEDNFSNKHNNHNFSYYHYKAILRSQRGLEDKVRGSLASMSNYRGKKISISTISIHGTIASGISKI